MGTIHRSCTRLQGSAHTAHACPAEHLTSPHIDLGAAEQASKSLDGKQDWSIPVRKMGRSGGPPLVLSTSTRRMYRLPPSGSPWNRAAQKPACTRPMPGHHQPASDLLFHGGSLLLLPADKPVGQPAAASPAGVDEAGQAEPASACLGSHVRPIIIEARQRHSMAGRGWSTCAGSIRAAWPLAACQAAGRAAEHHTAAGHAASLGFWHTKQCCMLLYWSPASQASWQSAHLPEAPGRCARWTGS